MSASYEAAGVSLAKAADVVDRLRAAVDSTRTSGAVGEFGAFAGTFALDDERLLVATTDGVGNKLSLCRRAGRLEVAGRDIVAHCVNDVATTGADPLFLLDYVAAGDLDLEEVAALVSGLAEACREAGCAILGGETAELPSVYREGELDFVGTCVGLVRRDELFDADLLLAPHRLYLAELRRLRTEADVHAFAHITGGGIVGNLARVLPARIGARIDPAAWQRPTVFRWLDEHGVDEDEQRRVFNLGVGMCAIVDSASAETLDVPVIGSLEEGLDGVVWADRT